MIYDINDVFTPEISPIHKMTFSVATQLKLEDDELAAALLVGKIPAGKLLAAKTGTSIIADPTKGASVTVADGKAVGILASDLKVRAGVKEYPIGVMISGEVYNDVIKQANGDTEVSEANKTALEKQNILFYNVKTLGK